MRRLVYACILAAMVCSSAFGVYRSELERMSTFISNFTELGYYNIINADTISDEELVHFGVWHNCTNNFDSRIKRCPDKNCL